MNETIKYCSKQILVDDFLAQCNPYVPNDPLKFDLRGYAAYVEDHQLTANDITPEILEMFAK